MYTLHFIDRVQQTDVINLRDHTRVVRKSFLARRDPSCGRMGK